MPHMIKVSVAAIGFVAILAGCTPRQSWIPPSGVSGRDMNKDLLLCRQLADPGDGAGPFARDAARGEFAVCMARAGYKRTAR